jgi:mannitol-1-phosphate 5-dehydrogenase
VKTGVVFGAGNVGRGLLGQVFSEAGLEVVFVDVADELIAALNDDRSYLHITVDNDSRHEVVISPVRAVRADDPAAVSAALLDAAVAGVCVGARVLPAVCRTIAPALLARIRAGRPPLNLLLAENLHEAASKVHDWLKEAEPELDDSLLAGVGLVSTSIGRMIPVPGEAVTRLGVAAIEVEPYRFLPIDAAAIRGDFLTVPGVVADTTVDFDFYSDRKLFLHNMGHAACAYLGRLCGDTYVWQTITRPEIRLIVRGAMVESACALASRYGRPAGPLLDHVDDLLHRFANRALGDTNERVGRDPRRKLAAADRFVGAIDLCRREGIAHRNICVGLAAGLSELVAAEGLSSVQIDELLNEQGLRPDERGLVGEYREAMADGFAAERVMAVMDRPFRESRIP